MESFYTTAIKVKRAYLQFDFVVINPESGTEAHLVPDGNFLRSKAMVDLQPEPCQPRMTSGHNYLRCLLSKIYGTRQVRDILLSANGSCRYRDATWRLVTALGFSMDHPAMGMFIITHLLIPTVFQISRSFRKTYLEIILHIPSWTQLLNSTL